jgi:hypothetical protein
MSKNFNHRTHVDPPMPGQVPGAVRAALIDPQAGQVVAKDTLVPLYTDIFAQSVAHVVSRGHEANYERIAEESLKAAIAAWHRLGIDFPYVPAPTEKLDG